MTGRFRRDGRGDLDLQPDVASGGGHGDGLDGDELGLERGVDMGLPSRLGTSARMADRCSANLSGTLFREQGGSVVRLGGVRPANSQRSRAALLSAAASVFIDQGVQAPVRTSPAAPAWYRHALQTFPTRADLVSAVYRHQVHECTDLAAQAESSRRASCGGADSVDGAFGVFLVTKHGLSAALGSDDPSLANLHSLLLDELVPAFGSLLLASQAAGAIDRQITRSRCCVPSGTCASSGRGTTGRSQADGGPPPDRVPHTWLHHFRTRRGASCTAPGFLLGRCRLKSGSAAPSTSAATNSHRHDRAPDAPRPVPYGDTRSAANRDVWPWHLDWQLRRRQADPRRSHRLPAMSRKTATRP